MASPLPLKRAYSHKPFKKATAKQTAAAIRLAASKHTPYAYYAAMIRAEQWITNLWQEPVKWRLEVVLQNMRRSAFVPCPEQHRKLLEMLSSKVVAKAHPVPKKISSNQLSLF